jgi:endonuclease/exonuclease/phosphatase family metal-dependent hydrolase
MRHRQLDVVDAALRQLTAEESARPPIVGGDFNMVVGEVECAHATGLGFVDLWGGRDRSIDEITMTTANPHLALGADRMRSRTNAIVTRDESGFTLDYLFSYGPLDREVLGRRTIGRGPVEAPWPSDHLGVLVDLTD